MKPVSYPLGPRQGKADGRQVLLVWAQGMAPEHHKATIMTEELERVWVVPIDPDGTVRDDLTRAFRSAEACWAWIEHGWKSVLMVVMHADRDLAMIGHHPLGDNWEHIRQEIHNDPRRPRIYLSEWRRKTGGKCRLIDIIQLANLHDEGIYAAELPLRDGVKWLSNWIRLIRENDLGPRIEWTLARQSLLSYRRMAWDQERRLRWHKDEELHRFEREVYKAQSPVRMEPADGHHERIHKMDFTAFYISIMAHEELPQECVGWFDEYPVKDFVRFVENGLQVLAEIERWDGEVTLCTTYGVPNEYSIAKVHRVAFYRPGEMLQPWARKMYRLRETCPKNIKPSVKGMAVALWGRLAQRNYRFEHDADWEYQPGDEYLYGRGEMVDKETGEIEFFDMGGKRWVCDPDGWVAERFPALGAHVMARGRLEMERWMALVEPVYCHTDSIWSLTPVPGTNALRKGLGGVTQEILRDVEFRGGVRYVGDVLDAAPGVARVGSRYYHPYDDEELLEMPGHAGFEVRR